MKKALALTLVLLTGAAFAEQVNVFTCGFEESEGYELGQLAGQQGWAAVERPSWMNVSNAESYDGVRSVHITGDTSGDTKTEHDLSYSNPYQASIIISFMIKPCIGYLRPEFFDANGRSIFKIHIKTDDIYLNAGITRSKNYNLSPNTWYPIQIILEPKNNIIRSIFIGDNLYVEPDENCAYSANASGDLAKIQLHSSWSNPATDTYVDDISVDLVPEPASIGLLALLGLCFLRKRA